MYTLYKEHLLDEKRISCKFISRKKRQKLDSKQSYLAVYSASFIPGNLIILQFSLKLRNVSLRFVFYRIPFGLILCICTRSTRSSVCLLSLGQKLCKFCPKKIWLTFFVRKEGYLACIAVQLLYPTYKKVLYYESKRI